MKYWELTATYAHQYLDSWYCKCEEDPSELIYTDKYISIIEDILEDLANEYSHRWIDYDIDEDGNYSEEYEYELDEWKDNVSFEATEINREDIEEDVLLIDETEESE